MITKFPPVPMLCVAFVLAFSISVLLGEEPPFQSAKNWEVRGLPNRVTWVELHEIDPADPSVIHVEVLSRKKGDKSGDVQHVQTHLAITLEALQRSVARPLPGKRGVYPESFDYGYKAWKASGNREVCRTTLYDCVDTGSK